MADNDQDRHARYVEKMFRQGKDRFGYDKMLGFYVPNDEKPILGDLFFGRLEGRSDADGGRGLGGSARLVGVRRDEVAPKSFGQAAKT
ncbi:MAG: hypothetical protein AABW87_03885 [Nanoarchaeota archaeon]